MTAFYSIVSATRIHLPPECAEIPEATRKHLCAYAVNAERLGLVAAIAVNSHEETIRALAQAAAPGLELHVLSVPCWGAFVAALNTLLEFAQRKGMKYILYQSLELLCSPAVLQKLLDHFSNNVLVVGPVLPGHTFEAGEQTLDGRTTPWNTLALWSVRKLALTGFPRIADGLARRDEDAQDNSEHALKRQKMSQTILEPELLGSTGWWSRQVSEMPVYEVPAGVEEVTTIALLQHLLGRHRAITVLVELPEQLMRDMSWSTNWGGDEKRKKWHEYKMKSKVSRPNAQLQELFNFHDGSASSGTKRKREANSDTAEADLNYGTVMHFGTTISPSFQVQSICLIAVGIFYFNSTAVLASAFQYINAVRGPPSLLMMTFIGSIIGGVYILMPISLQLTRMMTHRFDHAAGLLFFGMVLLLSHLCIVFSQLVAGEETRQIVLVAARIAQGLGSGVPFQSRFVLASLSTGDMHTKLQACAFVAGNLGLGLGALLPAVTSAIAGYQDLREEAPELWPSIVQMVMCSVFLIWVLSAFPRRLHFIPDAVRFAATREAAADLQASELIDHRKNEAAKFRMNLLISGTGRVFVQSAIIPIVALLMRDAQWTGHFRQCFVVALFYLVQLPFEALASRLCCICAMRTPMTNFHINRLGCAGGVIVLLALAVSSHIAGCDDRLQLLWRRMMELTALVVTLAVASPVNASRLYQMEDAERVIVTLEWMKAYIGRLLGPFVAVLIHAQVGYGPLLMTLCCATVVVAITA